MVGFNTLFTSSLDKPWGDPLPALERIHRSLRTFLSSNLWRGHREHGRVLVELPPMFRGNFPLCHFHFHCFIVRKIVGLLSMVFRSDVGHSFQNNIKNWELFGESLGRKRLLAVIEEGVSQEAVLWIRICKCKSMSFPMKMIIHIEDILF